MQGNQIREKTFSMKNGSGGHIFYTFAKLDHYLKNAAEYIDSAIEQGDGILFIENEPIWKKLRERLTYTLQDNQLNRIHYINNFDFYCQKGNFHSASILEYFTEKTEPYSRSNIPFRTWAHVEWSHQDRIESKITEFENAADALIRQLGIISVCAYDAPRITENLERVLSRCHEYRLTDSQELLRAEQYTAL